jgi:iron(III) transport system substrate-binding protein
MGAPERVGNRATAFAIFIFCVTFGWASTTSAQNFEEAKKEGKLVIYTAMQPADTNKLIGLYKDRYPTIEGTFYRAGSAPLVNRILTENRAGKQLFDIVSGKVSDLLLLKKKGVLAKLRSGHLSYYDNKFRDPQDYYVDIYSNYYTIAYNKELVKQGEIPSRWEELLDPRWAGGKMALDPRSFDWYYGMLRVLGEKKGAAFMRKLSGQKPAFREGNVLITNLLAAGEFPLAITYAHLVEDIRKKGAPVDWVPVTSMIAIPISIALPEKSPHPNAAQLFLDLVLSKEGAELLKGMGRVPTRGDVTPSAKRLDPKGLDLIPLHVSSDEMDPIEFRVPLKTQ